MTQITSPSKQVPEESPVSETGRRARPHRFGVSSIISVVWLIIVVGATLLAPWLAPEGYNAQSPAEALQGPSAAHIFGTDSLGRNLLVRLLYGAGPTLQGVIVAIVVALVLGVTAGLVGGYFGGKVDTVIGVIADVLMSIPGMMVMLLAFAIFPNNINVIMGLNGLFSSAAVYRVVRGSTLTITGELFITAARATGLTNPQIVYRHLAPRLSGLVVVQASVIGSLAFGMEVGLGFLGLDVVPPQPSWGGIVAEASKYITNDPWYLVPPTVLICLTIVSLGILGDLGNQNAHLRKSRSRKTKDAAADAAAAGSLVPQRDGAILDVRNLTVETMAGVPLVENVTFDICAGEVVGLVGESGAGKSVSARAILRLDTDTRATGEITFEGQRLDQLSERALREVRGRRIAFVGQDPMSALDPLFRIESQLGEALRTHQHLDRDQMHEAVIDLLDSVRIHEPEEVARKYPFEISGGMAQRVAIAIALAGNPELLIADEPTTALDVTVQMEVLGLLKSLQQERGLAIILVTHDWGVVADMCDRAVTMYAGEVVETGPIDDIFAAPRHPYTAALRRSDPHLLTGSGERLLTIPGVLPPPGHRPLGCRFAPRCPLATDECRRTHPPLALDEGGERAARCIRIDALEGSAIHV